MIFIVDLLSGVMIPIVSALGIGLLASIAPCALTSNIAVLAYVSEKLSSRGEQCWRAYRIWWAARSHMP